MLAKPHAAALSQVNIHASATKALLEAVARGPLPGWEEFSRHVRSIRIGRGEAVFRQGEAHSFVNVVRRGLIRNVYLRASGDAWIKSFTREGGFIASMAAIRHGGLAAFSAVCVEDSEVERFPYDLLEQFAERDLVWSNALRRAITLFAERKEQRERELLTLSPESRYLQLVGELPDIEQRVTQKDLAAYIGVTPVGLNRIIKRLRS